MKKNVFSLFLLMFIFSIFNYNDVLAEDNTCTYEVKAKLNKIASEVEASYSFVYDENNKVIGFDISIFNITEDIYITYKSDEATSNRVNVIYANTNNGTYTFRTYDLENIVTYEISIYTNKYNCSDFIRKLKITKPKRNIYHDYEFCQDEELEDYFYCKEWITSDISISESEIERRIKDKLDKVIVTTTTKCVACEVSAENIKNETIFKKNKMIVIIGIVVAMIIDMFLIIKRLINIRKARL